MFFFHQKVNGYNNELAFCYTDVVLSTSCVEMYDTTNLFIYEYLLKIYVIPLKNETLFKLYCENT